LGSARLAASGRIKALSAQIASPCEANSTLCKVQPRLSRKAKAKALLCANSVADSVLLSPPAPSAKDLYREAKDKAPSANDFNREAEDKAPSANDLSREAKDKALLNANSEAILASLKGGALHSKAKLAFKGRAKTVASPCEATLSGEARIASPIAKKKVFKAKPKVSQPSKLTSSFTVSPC